MKYLVLTILAVTAVACSTSEKSVQNGVDEVIKEYQDEISFSFTKLENLRTQLSDTYAYRVNEIPEGFNKIKVQEEEEIDLYEGYRIQIYSGEDVTGADTTAGDFRAWADTTIVGYQPNTYVFFRTPYYRVHVGDFHERERAIQFSNIVKRFFQDAWVVYDRVDPNKVPADTTIIELK
ncbi:MAG TPA: SPOR domain-containing protein [Gracilimonas sp.]|uniref:SPOR domain-containing protein n=1 Tax=Gracilimonas sp. TaxID=1974203 RepID=UPI002DAEC9C9|nr:SPOR domain-containing protein [Gracilimonas sp.]